MRSLFCPLFLLHFFLFVFSSQPASSEVNPDDSPALRVDEVRPRRVLVLNSYHQGYAWTDQIVRGVLAAFRGSPEKIEADLQYLDYRRFRQPFQAELFLNYVRSKYADTPPELILATDDPAVRLILRYRGTILPAVPVVFCGVNEFRGSSNYVAAHPEQRPWMAGVLEHIDLDDTVDLALELHPDTRAIVTVGEDEGMEFASIIAARHPGLQVRSIPAQHIELKQTGEELSKISEGTIVLFTPFSQDGAGRHLSLGESARFVTSHSKVPVYTASRPSLGNGVIGGKMADPYTQGQTAALMALSILRGASPATLGIQREAATLFEFDFNQLKRWKIKESSLPAGSVVINRPKSFAQTHPWLIVALCVFLGIQSVVILVLLMQHRRRQAAEAALRTHSQQLAHSNYMLEQFAYITAHDFQEPIRSVALFAELLRRDSMPKLDPEGQQAVEFVYSHSRRLHSMVRGLLAWVRSVDAPPDSAVWCDADQIMREVLERHRDAIEHGQVAVASSHLPSLAVHAHHMRELLHQLVKNAVEHGEKPGLEIAIRSERAENAWKISIFNSGPFIPETLHSRIFGVFRRLQASTDGIGMGLAICRRIVDYYGGRIWVESSQDQGCTFSFTVPDTPRPRVRRPYKWRLQSVPFSSAHAHSDH